MAGKNQHVVPHEGKWAVKGEGNQRASSIHDAQTAATERAREIARREKSELLVHGRDGESARAIPSGMTPTRRRVERASLPTWIKPQLAALVKTAPDGADWLHEIKFDGYRMHARLDAGRVQMLTRRGNDWTEKIPRHREGHHRPAGRHRLPRR
jgi:ATP-dependent DNA ligase